LSEPTGFFFPFRISAEKEELLLQHERGLKSQRDETASLNDQLIQAELQHARSLKEAIAASDAKVEEARKQFAEAEGQLRQELEEEEKLVKLEQERNAALLAVQASIDLMVKDVDDKALSKYLCLFA
jgi:septal ring factor EnvC (AmiA/AmiB activator)